MALTQTYINTVANRTTNFHTPEATQASLRVILSATALLSIYSYPLQTTIAENAIEPMERDL
jgi:hypothetical protein